jgi:hypothetical protein
MIAVEFDKAKAVAFLECLTLGRVADRRAQAARVQDGFIDSQAA